MIARMTEEQLMFWRALLAPFHPSELSETSRGGRKLTYVCKRALENRLDTVCGPHGWFPEYEATARGYKCRLSILVPMGNGTWVFMHKEDGAGFEEMGSNNKQTGEWEADVDNDEKSGYTNALRRAAQDAWGIGRYLYNKGIPAWLDPDAVPPQAPPRAPSQSPPRAQAPAAQQAPPPRAAAPPAPTQQAAPPQGGGKYDNFKVPRPGKAVFAWAKGIEQHFGTTVINGMKDSAKSRGYSTMFTEWTADEVGEICGDVIGYLRTLDNYKGEFDAAGAQQAGQAPAPSGAGQPPADPTQAKKDLIAAVGVLVKTQTGIDPTNDQVKQALGNIAAEVPNHAGSRGEVLTSLRDCADWTWLANIQAFINDQVRQARQAEAAAGGPVDDIPF